MAKKKVVEKYKKVVKELGIEDLDYKKQFDYFLSEKDFNNALRASIFAHSAAMDDLDAQKGLTEKEKKEKWQDILSEMYERQRRYEEVAIDEIKELNNEKDFKKQGL